MGLRAGLLLTAGFLSLLVGVVGIVVPVLPTTPFVLLAAGCFGSSSPKMYRWLANTRYFGAYVVNYKNGGGVARGVKIRSLIFLWGMLVLSMVLVASWPVRGVLVLVGLGVTTHILMIKTKQA